MISISDKVTVKGTGIVGEVIDLTMPGDGARPKYLIKYKSSANYFSRKWFDAYEVESLQHLRDKNGYPLYLIPSLGKDD